jgi:glycyl-tRNA synthetase beta chain
VAEFLLELFSEEIPARMQARAGDDLARLLTEKFAGAGLKTDAPLAHTGPRRLCVVFADLAERTEAVREEKKGPRVGAPEKAVEGFLRSAGLTSLDQCEKQSDAKGEFYVAVVEKPGRDTRALLGEIVPAVCDAMPWPKSMRSGARSERWVRPLRRIVCLFGGAVAPVEWAGITAGDQTEGHRVHGPGPFTVTDFASYKAALETQGHVRIDRAERRALTAQRAHALCADAGLELVEDEALLDEVAGLAEWPVPLLGEFDPEFLELPPEVIKLTMAKNQKYFAVRDPKTGSLAPRFVAIADLEPTDGGAASAKGYARVLSARLSDARFFWDEDRARSLGTRVEDLGSVVFHRKLGSVKDKAQRVSALARELAPLCGADPELAARAGLLAKADLTTSMVQEFTDLQGVMGAYYARESGEAAEVAVAIRDHYKPLGPSDAVPGESVSVAVALADKMDTLVGFWAIDEKPTGSKDPYALRRAALGAIRTVLAHDIRLPLRMAVRGALPGVVFWGGDFRVGRTNDGSQTLIPTKSVVDRVFQDVLPRLPASEHADAHSRHREDQEVVYKRIPLLWDYIDKGNSIRSSRGELIPALVSSDLLTFFADRLKIVLREEGVRHDLIDAVFALGEDDLVAIVARVKALQSFLATPDGENLLTGAKRAMNIVEGEEKKTGAETAAFDPSLLAAPEEKALAAALDAAGPKAKAAVEAEDYEAAMAAIAPLRPAIDSFFDKVTVNDPDPKLRANRLLLLRRIRDALGAVADFSKIGG